MNKEKFKSGFVTLIGKPNAGKSTLLNKILKNKIAIVTNKPQTTREQIKGIYDDENMQIIFLDTPGIHKSSHYLGKLMNKKATAATKGTDVICLLTPVNQLINENERHIIKILQERDIPIFLIITKIDLADENKLLQKINEWKNLLPFVEIIPISALNNFNIKLLIDKIIKYLPVCPKYYEETDSFALDKEYFIKEVIREKIILLTEQEIPHSVAVVIDQIEFTKILTIAATIVVERKSQKPIIIGNKGQMLKKIGINSRLELESYFNQKVMLKLFVKVINEWRNDHNKLLRLGYK